MIIKPHNFKILPSLLHLSYYKISNNCHFCYSFLTPQFKNFANSAHGYFFIGNATYLFFHLGTQKLRINYKIIATNAGDITLLVSRNVIFFGYFRPANYGVKREITLSASLPLPFQIFIRFFCCFTINMLSTFFCPDQFIAKGNVFSN